MLHFFNRHFLFVAQPSSFHTLLSQLCITCSSAFVSPYDLFSSALAAACPVWETSQSSAPAAHRSAGRLGWTCYPSTSLFFIELILFNCKTLSTGSVTLNSPVAGSSGYSTRYGWLQHLFNSMRMFCSFRLTWASSGLWTSSTGWELKQSGGQKMWANVCQRRICYLVVGITGRWLQMKLNNAEHGNIVFPLLSQ